MASLLACHRRTQRSRRVGGSVQATLANSQGYWTRAGHHVVECATVLDLFYLC